MTDRHLRRPDLPDFDVPAIHHGRVPSLPGGVQVACPADRFPEAEAT